jgi:hypothetical protein
MSNNKKNHSVSPTFVAFITIFLGLIGFSSYRLAVETGLINFNDATKQEAHSSIDSTVLNQKDSIIYLRNKRIFELEVELLKRPDTVFIKPKVVAKRIDTFHKNRPDTL